MKAKEEIEEILLTDYGCFDEFTVDKLFNLFTVVDQSQKLKVYKQKKILKLHNSLKTIESDKIFRIKDPLEWMKQKIYIEGKIDALVNL